MSIIAVEGSNTITLKRWANTAPTSKLGIARKIKVAPSRASATSGSQAIERLFGPKVPSHALISSEGRQFAF
jgi:hypothetical protein